MHKWRNYLFSFQLLLLLLTSCGVKGPVVPPKDRSIPSYLESFSKIPEYVILFEKIQECMPEVEEMLQETYIDFYRTAELLAQYSLWEHYFERHPLSYEEPSIPTPLENKFTQTQNSCSNSLSKNKELVIKQDKCAKIYERWLMITTPKQQEILNGHKLIFLFSSYKYSKMVNILIRCRPFYPKDFNLDFQNIHMMHFALINTII